MCLSLSYDKVVHTHIAPLHIWVVWYQFSNGIKASDWSWYLKFLNLIWYIFQIDSNEFSRHNVHTEKNWLALHIRRINSQNDDWSGIHLFLISALWRRCNLLHKQTKGDKHFGLFFSFQKNIFRNRSMCRRGNCFIELLLHLLHKKYLTHISFLQKKRDPGDGLKSLKCVNFCHLHLE